MPHFVLIVDFTLHPESADAFMPLITENARTSVEIEPGCRQFDVAQAIGDPDRVVLYEVYDDIAAFEVHRAMPHVRAFFAQADGMIASRAMTRLDLIAGNAQPSSISS